MWERGRRKCELNEEGEVRRCVERERKRELCEGEKGRDPGCCAERTMGGKGLDGVKEGRKRRKTCVKG